MMKEALFLCYRVMHNWYRVENGSAWHPTILTGLHYCLAGLPHTIRQDTCRKTVVGVEKSDRSIIPGSNSDSFFWTQTVRPIVLYRSYFGLPEHLIIQHQHVILHNIPIRYVKFHANSIPPRRFIRSSMTQHQIQFHVRHWQHQVLSHVRGDHLGCFLLHLTKTVTFHRREIITLAQKLCRGTQKSLLSVLRAPDLSNILAISRAVLLACL